MASRLSVFTFLGVSLASGLAAQVTNRQTIGNLKATQNPGCIEAAKAEQSLTPPDLLLGAKACVSKSEYDRAVRLVILLQLRAVYDSKRVTDKSARQAVQVLNITFADALSAREKKRFQAAYARFGGSGSQAHTAFCKMAQAGGPPEYTPTYMIQHGMGAFMGKSGNGLYADFRPKAEWQKLLRNYLKCSP